METYIAPQEHCAECGAPATTVMDDIRYCDICFISIGLNDKKADTCVYCDTEKPICSVNGELICHECADKLYEQKAVCWDVCSCKTCKTCHRLDYYMM